MIFFICHLDRRRPKLFVFFCDNCTLFRFVFSRKAAEKLKEELSMARMKALSESHRVLELERKLFTSECALKQMRIDIVKLQVKIEELQMKYEPNGKIIHTHTM